MFCDTKVSQNNESFHELTYKKGTHIYLPEDSSDKVYFIMSGRVKISSHNSEQDKEVTKTILNQGEVFGELAMIGQETRQDFAYAIEDTVVCELTVSDIKSLMKEHNQLSMFFMKIMGARMMKMEQRLESLVFKDSRSRIIEYILEMLEHRGQRVGYEHVIRSLITHQEIANITATSRQTVTTVLNDLRNDNIITFDRRRMLIRDLDRLKAQITS